MEAMVVIGIMTVLLLIITQIYALNYDMFVKQSARVDNETGAILAAKTIAESCRGGLNVEASRTINGTAYTSSDTVLVLRLPAVDLSNNILAGKFDYIAIARDGTETTKIFADVEADASSRRISNRRLITGYNQAIYFRYNSPDITEADRVSMFLLNSQTKRQTTVVTKAWTSIFLRNR